MTHHTNQDKVNQAKQIQLRPEGQAMKNQVQQQTAAGKRTNRRSSHALSRRRLILGCLVSLVPLTFAAAPALANTTHAFSHTLGIGAGEQAGRLSLESGGAGSTEIFGSGVAVNNETHAVYVADTANNRVVAFTAQGEFLLTFGKDVNKTKALGGLATEAERDVCTEEEVAMSGVECQKGLAGTAPGEFESPTFIAVDNDLASPSHGDLYVAGPGAKGESPKNQVSKFSATGGLQAAWGTSGQLYGPGEPAGEFGAPAGLAVDNGGNLWVYVGGTSHAGKENSHMYEFTQASAFTQSWEPGHGIGGAGGPSPQGLAVDGSDDPYVSENASQVKKLSSSGAILGTLATAPLSGSLSGLAVTSMPAPDVYVDFSTSIAHFSPACEPAPLQPPCEPAEVFGSGVLVSGAGLAVDSSDAAVYAADTAADRVDAFAVSFEAVTSAATEVTATTATLNGSVNPEGSALSRCVFEYGETNSYGKTVPCEGATGSGSSPVAVHAKIDGLAGGTSYNVRLVAQNGNSNGPLAAEDRVFVTPPTPRIAAAEAANVAASSATLTATVNPEGFPVTSCEFEYGTTGAYGVTVPCAQSEAQIGSGSGPVRVSGEIAGLAANTEYHWRLIARNVNGASTTPDHTFVYTTAGAELPDHRAYEMVTPPFKNGASIASVLFGFSPDISEAGSRVIAAAIQCFAGSEACTAERGGREGEPFSFTRTVAGWVTTPLAPSGSAFPANSAQRVGAAEGVALFRMPTPPAGEDDWYAREPSGSFVDIGPTSPPELGVSTVTSLKEGMQTTADLSHVVFGAPGIALWPFDGTTSFHDSLYEYVGTGNSEPFLVGVTGGKGSTELVGTCGTELGSHANDWNALSADGRTVFFTVCGSALYARVDGELADAHTVKLSGAQCESSSECKAAEAHLSAATFSGASEDGSRAFFVDTQQLTDTATEGTGSATGEACAQNGIDCNLYLYDLHLPEGSGLIDVSAGDSSGLGPQVQGVVGTSADGSHVYFVAKGVLTSTPNSQGEVAQPRQDNLYVYERDAAHPEGHLAFIATLPTSDFRNWVDDGLPTANVTPDGRFLVFESHGALTADDTRSDGAAQIYRYDAQSEALARISIGEEGFNDNGNAGVGDATIAPAASAAYRIGPSRGDPSMSHDGSYIFFQSPIALTPHALNDILVGHTEAEIPQGSHKEVITGNEYAENIYEYHEGHVSLVSDGRDIATARTPCVTRIESQHEAFISGTCLLGADATGSNVFFTTTDRLVTADTDTQLDIYDARICEPATGNSCIVEPSPPLPPCLGEACHGIPAPTPSLLAPGTASFNGQGNLTPPAVTVPPKSKSKIVKCKKVVVRKKGKQQTGCVKPKKKTKAKKSAKKTSRRSK